jgi:hypothetical protein
MTYSPLQMEGEWSCLEKLGALVSLSPLPVWLPLSAGVFLQKHLQGDQLRPCQGTGVYRTPAIPVPNDMLCHTQTHLPTHCYHPPHLVPIPLHSLLGRYVLNASTDTGSAPIAFSHHLSLLIPCAHLPLAQNPPLPALSQSHACHHSVHSRSGSFSVAVWLDQDTACILKASPGCTAWQWEAHVSKAECFEQCSRSLGGLKGHRTVLS